MKEETQGSYSDSDAQVHIVGPLRLQNELLCRFLARETGLVCICCPDTADIGTDQVTLILWDCADTKADNVWEGLDEQGLSSQAGHFIALFNLCQDWEICRNAIGRGVRGVFFEDDPPSRLAKGVQAILNEELWYPRNAFAECLFGGENFNKIQEGTSVSLTPREREILLKIESGGTNGEVAQDLCISPHTVKTHLYNIFHKINVPNRLQAALWASKHL